MRRSRAGARGVTLVELMVTVAIMGIAMLSLMQLIITSTRQNRATMERSELVRGGQTALSVMRTELDNAGLGLPRRFAIRGFDDPGVSAESCDSTPELEVVSLDVAREWTLSTVEEDTLVLADVTPTGNADAAIEQGDWLFFYKNARVDTAGTSHGHGMIEVGATRDVGGEKIAVGGLTFGWSQAGIDLANPKLDNGSGHSPVVLRINTSRFGVNCDDPDRPFLYWVRNGGTAIPLATYSDTRLAEEANPAISLAAGESAALRFRFHVDANGDGQTDDQNGDGSIDASDLVTHPALAVPAADLSEVTAIEVVFRLRSLEVDTNIGRFHTNDFVALVRLSNVNTKNPSYIFIDNTGL